MKWLGAFERSVMDEGEKILKRLDDLLGQTIYLGLRDPPKRPLQRIIAPLVVKDSDVVGRDGDKEEIVKMLLSKDVSGQSLSVIPIVGMGGIGKTTIAQLVYEDRRVQQHFAFKVWVTVSEHFNVLQITKVIYQKVKNSREPGNTELRELQRELNEALAGKMFLFVLDDVWNENYGQWDSLKSAFQSGARGSKVIVTTRSKEVALTMSMRVMHEVKLVSDEDCWRIFERHVFEDSAKAPAELQEIGRKIVKRCKGLPLAVKSLAGLLRCTNSKPEEWTKILNSDIWQLQFQKDLKENFVPAVWLSYQFLPPYLKRCFAYLSIFPKDHLFHRSDLKNIIWMWMAEGLLEPQKGKKVEEVGEEYLQALIGRSFFQYSKQDESNLIMHDIVHDLAIFISGEFSFVFNDSNDLSDLPTKACHLSCSKHSEVLKIMEGLRSQTRSLRTLLLSSREIRVYGLFRLLWSRNNPSDSSFIIHDRFFKQAGCLRVLSLSSYLFGDLPDSIGNLKYLRYLDLSLTSIKKLPDSIGNMKYLSYLDLSQTLLKELPDSICTLFNLQKLLLCKKLERLPTRFAALVNLRHLVIGEARLKEMPPQMCKLKSLETLSYFVLGENDGRRIKELRELPLLGGSFRISGLQHIVDVKDVSEANLKDKKFLSELILEWSGDSNITSSQQEREVLGALQPHTNLKELRIMGYRGTKFPDWVGHESFRNMVQVNLSYCNVRKLPPLGQLSSLRRLEMYHLDGVVSIGNEFCGSSSTTTNHPFTSLEHLKITDMASWEEWSFSSDRLGQEGGIFPSLTELRIERCKKLIEGLPNCHLPSLKSIEIKECDEMVGVFVEMDTNAFPSLESLSLFRRPRLQSLLGLPDCHLPSLKSIIKVCFEMVGIFVCQIRQDAFSSLESMSVSSCPRLESLLGRQSFPSMKNLEISICEKLWENRMNLGLERLPSLMTLSIYGIDEEVDSFPEDGLLPTTLTELSIHHFKKLKGLNGKAFQHLTSLQNLKIEYCRELECLPQEGLPLSLSSLTIRDCPKVLKQRCQRGTGEDWPKIQHILKIDIL